MTTVRKLHKHMHVDLRLGSTERVQRHHRARRGPTHAAQCWLSFAATRSEPPKQAGSPTSHF